MTNPTFPLAPGERLTLGTAKRLFFNRYLGAPSTHQAERQAIGGTDVPVTLARTGRPTVREHAGTLEADGHVGVWAGTTLELWALSIDVVDFAMGSSSTDTGIRNRLVMLGYVNEGYQAGEALSYGVTYDAFARQIYDFQADHGLVCSGHLDDDTRAAIVSAFGE